MIHNFDMGEVGKINCTSLVQSVEKLSTLLCTDFIVIYIAGNLLCFSVVYVVVSGFFFACYKCYCKGETCKVKMVKLYII